MLRKSLLAVFTLVVCVGMTLSDEIRAVILKVDSTKKEITFAPLKGKGKNAEKGPEQTLPVASDVKITKGKFNMDTKKVEPGEAISGGLTAEVFTKINAEKGLNATITTSDDGKKITAIMVGGKGGKKKNQ